MTTDPELTLTYNDLKTQAITLILALCKNVEPITDIPSCMRAGYEKKYTKTTGGSSEGGASFKLTSGSAVKNVTIETVKRRFNSFLVTCGISEKSNQIPTTRGLINFWNNVASFCTAYLCLAVGGFPESNPPTRVIFDDSVNMGTAKPYPLNKEEEVITSQDINEMFNNIKAMSSNISKIKKMVYDMETICSCSSSSSSSSCSSSIFIGYMKLGK